MAALRRLLLSSWRCKRSQIVPARHASHFGPSSTNSVVSQSPLLHECALKNFSIGSTMYNKQSSPLMPMVGDISFPILPLTPVERLTRFRLPTVLKHVILEMPSTEASLINNPIKRKIEDIQAPQRGKVLKINAESMIIIRRRKMKKHQRRKWLKKFRVKLMNRAKKRYIIKETLFLSQLEEEMKLGEAFDAQQYAKEKIQKAYQPKPEKAKLIRPLPWEFEPLFYNSQKKKQEK